MVPASTFMYGSILTAVTLKPRARSKAPMLEVAIPLPSEDTTPPVMKMYLVSTCSPTPGLNRSIKGVRFPLSAVLHFLQDDCCFQAPANRESGHLPWRLTAAFFLS